MRRVLFFLVFSFIIKTVFAAAPTPSLTPTITGVANFTPDFNDTTVYKAMLTAINSAGINDIFQEDLNLSTTRLCYKRYEPLTTSVQGQSNFRTYLYQSNWFYYECWIGQNKNSGFFLVLTSLNLISCTLNNDDTLNTGDQYTQSFSCAFKSQIGTYDEVKADLQLSAVNDSTLIPITFELSNSINTFTFKQGQKNFAYANQLYTVSSSNFSSQSGFQGGPYQLTDNQWPCLFANWLQMSVGWKTENTQFFIVVGGKRVLPRMWYRSAQSDIAWTATTSGYLGIRANLYSLTDTDGGGQYDVSEYFYRRDPLDAQDDDPNYQAADPNIINIAIDNGYISIDDERTDLPLTGDVNIDADPEGRSADIRATLQTKLEQNNAYVAMYQILTGVGNNRATGDLPRWEIPNALLLGLGDPNNPLAFDFNVIKDNERIWDIFQLGRYSFALLITIFTLCYSFNMIMDAMKV